MIALKLIAALAILLALLRDFASAVSLGYDTPQWVVTLLLAGGLFLAGILLFST